MLSEHVVASIHTPAKTSNVSGSKDVGIFLYELQPQTGQRQVFKRSATAPNCLAVSDTHVFAAQAEKAVVHVYGREKGNHEATIPFNEKVTCIALAASHSVLVAGTETGRLMIWEIATGRLISAPQSHLQAVTSLVVEPSSHFFLSGSLDSTILVWSLPAILSFSNTNSTAQVDPRSPVHSLSSHRGPITSLDIGHSYSQSNLAVSGSEDKSAIIWNYRRGIALRTYLLYGIPRALVFDVCDRGFYTTYSGGSVQLVDFYAGRGPTNELYDENDDTPLQPGEKYLWQADGQDLGDGMSLAMSWDGTRLLSGHKNGKIVSWDVGKGSFMAIIDTLPGPVSNLTALPIEGLLNTPGKPFRLTELVKPRLSSGEMTGVVPADYTFTMNSNNQIPISQFSAFESTINENSRFQDALMHPSFPLDLLEAGMAELAAGGRVPHKTANGVEELDMQAQETQAREEVDELRAQNERLKEQNAHLQRLQKASFDQVREKTRIITSLVNEQQQLAEIAKKEYDWEIRDMNVEWDRYQQHLREQTQLALEMPKGARNDSTRISRRGNGVVSQARENEDEARDPMDEDESIQEAE